MDISGWYVRQLIFYTEITSNTCGPEQGKMLVAVLKNTYVKQIWFNGSQDLSLIEQQQKQPWQKFAASFLSNSIFRKPSVFKNFNSNLISFNPMLP